jgi:outer membrane receptor for ferrienterochelin and colicin
MTEQPFGERNRFRKRIARISAIVVAAQAIAAPESRLQEIPLAVSKITAEELNAVPANRDLRAILDLHNGLQREVGAGPLR